MRYWGWECVPTYILAKKYFKSVEFPFNTTDYSLR
jgi:hypothetical protein